MLLHIDNEQSKEVLKDAIQGGIERGLMFRSEAPLKLLEHFNTAKEKGYFPVGCVLDAKDPYNLELLFHRHPKQDPSNKLSEIKTLNPTEL